MLSNGTCASACLDFADIVLHVPGVRLVGADTSADGNAILVFRANQLPVVAERIDIASGRRQKVLTIEGLR